MKKIIAVLLSIVLTACAHKNTTQATSYPKYNLTISQTNKDEQFVDDIGISLKPIMLDRATTMGNLFASYSFSSLNPKVQRNDVVVNLPDIKYRITNTTPQPNQQGNNKTILISLPAFEIQVTNSSTHAISFQKVAVRMVDDAGNSYPAFMKQDVMGFIEQEINALENHGFIVNKTSAIEAARSLRLFDKNYESLPNLAEKRILAFDFGTGTDLTSYYQRFKNSKYVRVILFDVPVKFDEAGNISKVAKFEYTFDIVQH
jgi:hypothetical protein